MPAVVVVAVEFVDVEPELEDGQEHRNYRRPAGEGVETRCRL